MTAENLYHFHRATSVTVDSTVWRGTPFSTARRRVESIFLFVHPRAPTSGSGCGGTTYTTCRQAVQVARCYIKISSQAEIPAVTLWPSGDLNSHPQSMLSPLAGGAAPHTPRAGEQGRMAHLSLLPLRLTERQSCGRGGGSRGLHPGGMRREGGRDSDR